MNFKEKRARYRDEFTQLSGYYIVICNSIEFFCMTIILKKYDCLRNEKTEGFIDNFINKTRMSLMAKVKLASQIIFEDYKHQRTQTREFEELFGIKNLRKIINYRNMFAHAMLIDPDPEDEGDKFHLMWITTDENFNKKYTSKERQYSGSIDKDFLNELLLKADKTLKAFRELQL